MSATLRQGETVTPLELFFDLVFVLAITQCTQLMADEPTWEGIAKGLLVLAVLWWSWIGYAWLTSVVDPEEGAVRLVIFAAMAGLLVASICVPGAFDDSALDLRGRLRGRAGRPHRPLLDRERGRPGPAQVDERPRASRRRLRAASWSAPRLPTARSRARLWCLAIVIDFGGPYFFGAAGWKLMPEHFAERHGLIIIIALGESIVAIGAGVTGEITAGVVAAAVIGIVLAATMWWAYFDVVALAATRRLASIDGPPGAKRGWPATPTRISTCPWSPGSSWSRSG